MSEITELRVGDYIEKSELDTEQKYNDVVEVFEQFGFSLHGCNSGYEFLDTYAGFGAATIDLAINLLPEDAKRKLTYTQIMSLKKVDWENAPDGAEFYADGMFFMVGASAIIYYWLDESWHWDTTRSKQTLMGFDDYEERPDKTVIKGECGGPEITISTTSAIDEKHVQDVIGELKEFDGGKFGYPKILYPAEMLEEFNNKKPEGDVTPSAGFYEALGKYADKEGLPLGEIISEEVTEEDRSNMFITAVQYMQEEGFKFDGRGWYKKDYVKRVK